MFLAKKWGILIKKESESLIFTGLEIPRDYYYTKEGEMISQEDLVNMLREIQDVKGCIRQQCRNKWQKLQK